MEQGQAVQFAPTDAELERAIASVPGVVSAGIDRSADTGRSRMRLRLAPGEDEEAVAWAVAATLRERFGIALDPDAIRPRPAALIDPANDPVRLIHGDGGLDTHGAPHTHDAPHTDVARDIHDTHDTHDAPIADAPTHTDPDPSGRVHADGPRRSDAAADRPVVDGRQATPPPTTGLLDTRERLRRAAADALGGVGAAAASHGGSDAAAEVPPASPLPGPDAARLEQRGTVPRPAIQHLEVLRHTSSVDVTVVLVHEGRSATGHVQSVPTTNGTLRAVAEATVAALRVLAAGSLIVGIDRVAVHDADDVPTATVVLSLLTRRGEERLLGASIVRDNAERAVLRATLDALNRRVTPMLADPTLLEHPVDLDASA